MATGQLLRHWPYAILRHDFILISFHYIDINSISHLLRHWLLIDYIFSHYYYYAIIVLPHYWPLHCFLHIYRHCHWYLATAEFHSIIITPLFSITFRHCFHFLIVTGWLFSLILPLILRTILVSLMMLHIAATLIHYATLPFWHIHTDTLLHTTS
jgi:hypothetical protein